MTPRTPEQTLPRRACLARFRPALFLGSLLACAVAAVAQTDPPVITSSTNTLGTVGQPFTYTITASGNPNSFGASGLPSGLLPPASGSANITGLPQSAGYFTSIIRATNPFGSAATNLYIQVNPPAAPALASPVTVFGVQGQPLSYALRSTPNYSNVPTIFSASGLPLGATLISNVTTNTAYTNVLVTNYFINSPSLLTNGSFVVPVVASNAGGASTNNVTFIINPTNVPVFTITALPVTATVGVPFSFDVTAINSPLRFRVTSINGGPAVSITNGPLTNGLSFSNVTSGSTVIGRVYGTPGLTNQITLSLEAANNFGTASTNLVIDVVNPSPTVVLSQPLGEGHYMTGSSFYLNAQVFDEPDDILVPSSFQFQETGAPLPGTVGILGDYFGLEYYPSVDNPVITASGQNALNQTTTSLAFPMGNATPQAAFPSIEMLPLNVGQQLVAGGKVILSARATIPSTTKTIDRVEFYVNKVYVGSRTAPEADTEGVYEYEWTTPTTPGSFQVTARAVSLNLQTGTVPPAGYLANTSYWASVIARKPTIVNTKQGTAPSVAITSPANNGNLTIGVANRIQATALLSGGAVQSVEFFANGKRIPSLELTGGTPNPDTQVPFEVDFVPNSFGAYELYAIATGSNGLQTVSPVVIANVPSGFVPTAVIKSPQYGSVVPYGSSIPVNYEVQDSDGYIKTLQLLVNGAVAAQRDADTNGDGVPDTLIGAGRIDFRPPSVGAYEFKIRTTDNAGNIGESPAVRVTVEIGVSPTLPLVVLGGTLPGPKPIEFVVGSEFFYNANVTAFGGATIASNGVSFYISGQSTVGSASGVPSGQGTFSARGALTAEGERDVYAEATDSKGNVGTSSTSLLLVGSPAAPLPTAEMLPLNPGTTVGAGGRVLLKARVLFPATTPFEQRVEFYANGAFIGVAQDPTEADPEIYEFTWRTPSTAGSYQIVARALAANKVTFGVTPGGNNAETYSVDNYGSKLSDNFTTVTAGTSAIPVVSIKSPVEGTSVPVGSPITLQVTASIPGSTIARVEYYANGDFIGSSATAGDSYSVEFTPNSKGEITLIAVAVSTKGFKGQSNPVKINVPLTGDPSIKFLSPSEGVTFPPGTTFTAAAEASINSDTQAPIQNVRFFLNEVQQGLADTNAPYSQQITLRGVGNYFLKAIVTDIYGSTASVQRIVTCANPSPATGNPPIITMTHPTPGGEGDVVNDFSTPSQFFFNALVTLPSGVTVAPGGVKFFANGVPVEGTVNNIGKTYSVYWQPERIGNYDITAQVTDSRGITGVSEPLNFEIAAPIRPLPSVRLLPLASAAATTGSVVILQAETYGDLTQVSRVDFYANGVFIGAKSVNSASTTISLFQWKPPAAGLYVLTARAIQVLGETGDNSVISEGRSISVSDAAGDAPVVILSQQPISERNYVVGSQLFFNATAAAFGGATIPDDGVTFYYGDGLSRPAVKSGVTIGTQDIYATQVNLVAGNLYATARDSRNAVGNSSIVTLGSFNPSRPFPSVAVVTNYLTGRGVFSAGTPLELRALATFPASSATNATSRVEFYANGAYLGAGAATNTNRPGEFSFVWLTPDVGGTFDVRARAVALDSTVTEKFTTIDVSGTTNTVTTTTDWFASIISYNSATIKVEAIPGDLVPGSNEAFVVQMYQNLLYRDPTYNEWFSAKEALNKGTYDRATFVMSQALMGYSEGTQIFNRLNEYGRTSAKAFSTYARLGLTPTTQDVTSFLALLKSDFSLLPYASTIPQAPWGATYGLATAIESVFTENAEFQATYPEITGLDDEGFVRWLAMNMFKGQDMGDSAPMITMMSLFPGDQFFRFGAAAGVWNQFSSFALAASVGGILYDYYGTPIEKTFERRLGTAALQFALSGVWPSSFSKVPLYSRTVVQGLLDQYTSGGSTASAGAPARGPVRSYQGVFGTSLSAASVAARAVSAAPQRINGELRIATSTSGTYSGVLTLDNGTVYRYKGLLKPDWSISDQWAPGVSVNLTPVEQGSARYLSGTVTRGSTTESVVAGRNIFSKDAPFGSPGNYTLSLRIDPAPEASDRLQGSGYATVKISATGLAKIAGRLADNTPFTASIPVWGATGVDGLEALLVHRVLAKGAGSVGGEIYRQYGGVGTGDLLWQVAPSVVGPRRELTLDATLSPYSGSVPATGTVLPVGWKWNVPFSLTWNADDETGAVGFSMPGTFTGSTAGLSLKVNTSSGVVGGSFIDFTTGAKYKVGGILDQGSKAIDGFFLTPNSSGRVEVNR